MNLQYAPVLFTQAGLSKDTSSFVASGVSGILLFVCTVACQFFTDTCKLPLLPTLRVLTFSQGVGARR